MEQEPFDPTFAMEGAGDLPRPGLPPTAGERIRAVLQARGISTGRVLGTAMIGLLVVVLGWWLLRPPPAPVEASIPVETTGGSPAPIEGAVAAAPTTVVPGGPTTTAPTAVVAHAAGAVARPGLYRVRPGARVADLVEAAGGLTPRADPNRINLAAPVADGERVYVLAVGEPGVPEAAAGDGAPTPMAAGSGGASDGGTEPAGPVDLNTATVEQLDTLPGVGPSTAQAIIDYRTEHGRFTSVEDLLDVRGIGDAKLAELRDRVTV